MKNWKTISLFVCLFAFARELRPIEPFYSAYMTSPAINITLDQAARDVYSIGAYSCFVLIIIVFLITDYLRYKPILIVDGICGMLTYCSIVGHPSILRMQVDRYVGSGMRLNRYVTRLIERDKKPKFPITILINIFLLATLRALLNLGQVFYGFFFSSEVAYFGYLYAMIDDKRYYQRITGQARAACLSGKFFSSLFAQSVSLINGSVPYVELVYLSIFGMFFTVVWAFMMPAVTNSVYFHSQTDQSSSSTVNKHSAISQGVKPPAAIESKTEKFKNADKTKERKISRVFLNVFKDFRRSYSNPYVIKLCLWWSLAFGTYVQVYTYINVLYTYILHLNEDTEFTLYNGAAESLNTLIGAIAAYSIGKLDLNWYKVGDLFLGIGSILAGIVLLGCFYIRNMWLIYAFYIIYGCLYQTMLTVAESEVAKRLNKGSYGLVFGFNSFVALFIHTLMTYGIIQEHFISVTTIQLFLIYGVYYMALGVLFLILSIKSHFSTVTDRLVNNGT